MTLVIIRCNGFLFAQHGNNWDGRQRRSLDETFIVDPQQEQQVKENETMKVRVY